jgi:hypothetical protein
MTATEPRVYRFAPRDRAGWMLGLGAVQCISLAVALLVAALLVSAGAPVPSAAMVLLGAGVFAFGRWHGRALHEWLPVIATWWGLRARGQHRWTARVPLLAESGATRRAPLPPFLAGLEILEASSGWTRRQRLGSIGLIADRRERLLTGVVRVQGREFALAERAEQDRWLAGWGEVLAGFCRERGAVARVTWCEWAGPASLDDHHQYLDSVVITSAAGPERDAYLALIEEAGPMTTRHDVLVAVTVDARRVQLNRERGERLDDALAELVLEELRLFTLRLDDAGLRVDVPLSPGEVREVLRTRLDPRVQSCFAARRRAGFRDALVGEHNSGPLAVGLDVGRVQVDGSWHRGYWIAEWPRLELHPAWMEPLLLHVGGIRTIAVVFEPIPPSRSQRQIDRDATRLASDEEQRAKRGFRIGARHRRAQDAVREREHEVVAGYAELEYAGFLTVTGHDVDELEAACAEYEHAAAQVGLELRALDGQHDAGLGACLPIGRYPTVRRFT